MVSPIQRKYKATSITPVVEELGQRAWISCQTDDPNTTVLIETDRTTLIELCKETQAKLAPRPKKTARPPS